MHFILRPLRAGLALAVALTVCTFWGCILTEPFQPLSDDHPTDATTSDASFVLVDDDGDAGPPCTNCAAECILGHCAVNLRRMPDSKDEGASNGQNGIECPAPGEPFYGQDCNYRLNVPSFVTNAKIAVDTITGLVWERRAPADVVDFDGAVAHCSALGEKRFAGFADWRLPTAREVITIANMGKNIPGLDQSVFDSFGGYILTSTVPPSSDAGVYALMGSYPTMIQRTRTAKAPTVRCVRGGPLPTGPSIVWQRSHTTDKTWAEALAYCEALELDGITDWRLPSYKELWSIVAVDRTAPAIDTSLFLPTPSAAFWSSSPNHSHPDRIYVVAFKTGADDTREGHFGARAAQRLRVRCVSGGS
jgi:hypothetical protein